MIRVLIVDDSAIVRAMVRQVMENDERFQIAGEASNGEAAVKNNEQLKPDLVIMDINMPIMDGIEATVRILKTSSPVVVIFTTEDSAIMGYRCIQAGAVEVISKPDLAAMTPGMMKLFCDRIAALGEKRAGAAAVRAVSLVSDFSKKVTGEHDRAGSVSGAERSGLAAAETAAQTERGSSQPSGASDGCPYLNPALSQLPGEYRMLVAGASPGGPAALQTLLSGLGPAFPLPVLITQHIDSSFDVHFAGWLNESTGMSVEIAKEGAVPLKGHAYLAPADRHLLVKPSPDTVGGCVLTLSDDPPVHFLKPAVDKLFFSASEVFKNHTLAVLLTGMGRDGADGCKRIVEAGGYTVAESEQTCAVFGMPRAAIECGAASAVVQLGQMPDFLRSRLGA